MVEDDEAIRKGLVDYLQDHGDIEVDGARDGVDGLHQILTRRYAVVVLDMMMPKMSGGDFLDSLKAMRSDPSLALLNDSPAIIVVTAAAAEELPDETIRQRFTELVRAVFRKPVDCAELARAVQREMTRPQPDIIPSG